MRTQLLGLAAVVATLVGFEGKAAAQQTAFGDKKFALQQFEPAPAGDRFFGIPDAAVGSHPLYVNLIGNYALKPLKLQDRSPGQDKELGYITKNQLYIHLNGTITLAKRLLINVDVPFAIAQGGDDNLNNGQQTTFQKPTGGHLGDLRLGLRLALVGHPLDPFSIAVAGDVWLPTGDKDNFTSDGRTRVNPKLVMSGQVGTFYYSYNVGFLFRKYQDLGSPEVGNAITYGAGVGVQLANNMVQIGPELYGNTVVPKNSGENKNLDGSDNELFGRHSTPLEVILGAKFRVGDIQIGAAAGPGLTKAPGTPQLRALLSVGLIPEEKRAPEDRDHDGIVDSMDACIDVPGVPDPDPKKNGCPPPPPPADMDRDGIPDAQDACKDVPGVPNADPAKNGCPPDQDGDGILDNVDACPTVAGVANADPSKNGCPADQDNDGIPDAQDACPAVAGVKSDDPKKNGCPPDKDGDGIIDSKDACPDVAGVSDPDPAKNGCPARAQISGKAIQLNEEVQFDTGKTVIKPASDKLLQEVAQILKDHPEIELVSIEGHTDNVGQPAANLTLSKGRAASVVKWLTDKKKGAIDPRRLRSDGYGDTIPVADNTTADGRQKNRRVEIKILKLKGEPADKPTPHPAPVKGNGRPAAKK